MRFLHGGIFMKGNLNLNIIEAGHEEYFLTEDLTNNNDYILNCFINIDSPITKLQNKNQLIKKNLVEQYITTNNPKEKEIIYNYLNKDFDLIGNCEFITLDSINDEFIIDYLNKNPSLYTKKIIIKKIYTLKDFEYVKKTYQKIPNIYVYIKGNKAPITIDDYEKTIKEINNIINKIKKYKLSQLEQIMYAYDIIRSKVYKEENKDETDNVSRDLTSVLLGNKIVCVGYAKIFEEVLTELGIKVSQHHLINKSTKSKGHVLNIVYVKDKKYNLDGIYYFDLTWDSNSKENDNSYLNSYKFFAKTKKEIELFYKEKYYDESFKALSENFIDDLIELLKKRNIMNINQYIIKSINELSIFITKKELFNFYNINLNTNLDISIKRLMKKINIDEIIKELELYKVLFNRQININILLEILYNVRKIEYYENPQKYAFDFLTLSTITYNSQWKFDDNSKEYFINAIYDKVPLNAKNFKQQMKKYSNETDLEKRINQVKLVKVLKKINEKKERD